ncbi:diacylglycerol kinase (ATP) [Trifolium repens]|nr:diacylglycerol kinase (ATP) [Trifolium repens]
MRLHRKSFDGKKKNPGIYQRIVEAFLDQVMKDREMKIDRRFGSFVKHCGLGGDPYHNIVVILHLTVMGLQQSIVGKGVLPRNWWFWISYVLEEGLIIRELAFLEQKTILIHSLVLYIETKLIEASVENVGSDREKKDAI